MPPAALQVMFGRTLLKGLICKKQDLVPAEIISASLVTPRVFTTLENGMDASPTERQSTGTVSLLDDGIQRCSLVFCSLSVFHQPYFNLATAGLSIS